MILLIVTFNGVNTCFIMHEEKCLKMSDLRLMNVIKEALKSCSMRKCIGCVSFSIYNECNFCNQSTVQVWDEAADYECMVQTLIGPNHSLHFCCHWLVVLFVFIF